MPKTPPPPETETEETAASPFAGFLGLQQSGLGPMRWFGQAWAENMGELGEELTRFVADRIKEDVKTQHQILHAKSPDEIREIQGKFFQTAFDQYAAESGKLTAMHQKFLDRLTSSKSE